MTERRRHAFVRDYVGEDPVSKRYRAACICGWKGARTINRYQNASDVSLIADWNDEHMLEVEADHGTE